MKTLVYRARCAPRFDLPWADNMDSYKPLRILRSDTLPGNLRLEKWYYFWIHRNYTDPMVLIRNNDHCWTVHPGQNRWIMASLVYPRDQDVILITDRRLVSWPEEIHSVEVSNFSDLRPNTRPWPRSEQWLGKPPRTSWDEWGEGYRALAARIRQRGQGCLALMDGKMTYTLGEGKIMGCWQIQGTGLREIFSLFTFADSLGWNQP